MDGEVTTRLEQWERLRQWEVEVEQADVEVAEAVVVGADRQ